MLVHGCLQGMKFKKVLDVWYCSKSVLPMTGYRPCVNVAYRQHGDVLRYFSMVEAT